MHRCQYGILAIWQRKDHSQYHIHEVDPSKTVHIDNYMKPTEDWYKTSFTLFYSYELPDDEVRRDETTFPDFDDFSPIPRSPTRPHGDGPMSTTIDWTPSPPVQPGVPPAPPGAPAPTVPELQVPSTWQPPTDDDDDMQPSPLPHLQPNVLEPLVPMDEDRRPAIKTKPQPTSPMEVKRHKVPATPKPTVPMSPVPAPMPTPQSPPGAISPIQGIQALPMPKELPPSPPSNLAPSNAGHRFIAHA